MQDGMKKKIFVVDDDPTVLEYMKTVLQCWKYQCCSCENGVDAIPKIIQENPDLILMDIMLPDIDGITLCRRLKINIKTGHIPVIIITSLTDAMTMDDVHLFGAVDYIFKPFDQNLLKKKLEKALQKRSSS